MILMHSHPEPWGHPTGNYVAEAKDLSAEQRKQLNAAFEAVMNEMKENGELIGSEALGEPSAATLYRWDDGEPTASNGPYASSSEQFAGFFLIDVADRERAEAIAARFSGPGETVELRPTMSADKRDAGQSGQE